MDSPLCLCISRTPLAKGGRTAPGFPALLSKPVPEHGTGYDPFCRGQSRRSGAPAPGPKQRGADCRSAKAGRPIGRPAQLVKQVVKPLLTSCKHFNCVKTLLISSSFRRSFAPAFAERQQILPGSQLRPGPVSRSHVRKSIRWPQPTPQRDAPRR